MKVRTITFVNPTFFSYAQRVLKGIAQYVAVHPHLRLRVHNHPAFEPWWQSARIQNGGVIGLFGSPGEVAGYQKEGLPVVNAASLTSDIRPWVHIDETAVGRLAGEAFLTTGLHRFVFITANFSTPVPLLFSRDTTVPIATSLFNRQRMEGFQEALKTRHDGRLWMYSLESRMFGSPGHRQLAMLRLADFLQTIPQPFGIFCVNDLIGHVVLEGCRVAGLRVPDEVQLISVDNDELLCLGSEPPLASIDQGEERVGWQAAALLDQLLQGKADPDTEICLSPIGLVERPSFDTTIGGDDPIIQIAWSYMRQHLDQPLPVGRLAALVKMERRTFERRFRKVTGQSPATEQARLRLDKARRLLLTSDKTVKEISQMCGYLEAKRLHEAFQRTFGLAPLAYRRQQKNG
jgi:LacI family transcriptional regulator